MGLVHSVELLLAGPSAWVPTSCGDGVWSGETWRVQQVEHGRWRPKSHSFLYFLVGSWPASGRKKKGNEAEPGIRIYSNIGKGMQELEDIATLHHFTYFQQVCLEGCKIVTRLLLLSLVQMVANRKKCTMEEHLGFEPIGLFVRCPLCFKKEFLSRYPRDPVVPSQKVIGDTLM